MKKALAALMLAAMMLSVGCGNQAKEAQQKVEQAADSAKDAAKEAADSAAAKVDEAKDAANQAASDAAAKVDEAKNAMNQAADDAAAKVDEMKSDAASMAQDAVDKMDAMAGNMAEEFAGRTVALSGIVPGSSLEDVEAMFGEATAVEGNVMTFVDGLKVTLDDAKQKVKSISTMDNSFETPEGIYVGASEYDLNDYCGPADSIRQINGGAEYEYRSGDKKSAVVYKAQNGVITEITCTLK